MYNLTEKMMSWFCPPQLPSFLPSSYCFYPPSLPPRGLVRAAVSPHPHPEGLHGRGGEPGQAVPDLRAPPGTCLQPAPVFDADAAERRCLQPSGRGVSLWLPGLRDASLGGGRRLP